MVIQCDNKYAEWLSYWNLDTYVIIPQSAHDIIQDRTTISCILWWHQAVKVWKIWKFSY